MATDTITGALSAKDTLGVEHTIFPQTNISAVQGLQTELNKIIKAISTSGGTITLTKNDGTTLTATIGTATTSADGLLSKTDKTKLDGIATGANNYSLPTATSGVLGGVKIGNNITNSGGTISLSSANVVSALGFTPPKQDTTYTLTTASASTLGGIKVGSGLSISNGVLSSTLPTASASVLGGVKTGSNITNNSGTISLTKANVTAALGFTPSSISGGVSGVKGSAESTYRTGQVNITKDNIGLGNVDNTPDDEKTVAKANQLTWGNSIKVNLDSEDDVSFDGSESVEIGVLNVLPIAHGGTGNNKGYAYGIGSQDNVLYNSVNLDELKPPVTDGYGHWSDFVCYSLNGGSTNAPEGYSSGFLMMFFGTSVSVNGYIQLFFTETAPYKVFMRRSKGNSTAKTWKQISA